MIDLSRTALDSDRILQALAEHQKELRELGVVKIGLFGSYRRNEPNPGSDIDFIVTLENDSFNQYMDIKFYLEDLFRAPIDLVIEDSIKPSLRAYIMDEVTYAEGY